jgi:glyoxylase-like metal-dependent hydrolase (beta-lactamase superfamily II)
MLLRTLMAALVVTAVAGNAQAQNAAVAAASKAMGTDTLTSITYSGTARNGAFGQSKAVGMPLGPVNNTQITAYTRTINFAPPADPAALVSRATGPTMPPTVPGTPAPTPGVFNQNISGQQLNTNWGQALNVWTTPWGFLKGAAANNATARAQGGQQIVSFSPPNVKSPSGQMYTVTGYINNQNLVTKVETRVENAVVGDLLVEFEYSNYRNVNGVQVPGRIVQKQAGLETFNADITAAMANPSNLTELLTVPPAPGRGGGPGGPGGAAGPGRGGPPPAPAAPAVEKLGEGAFKIGGNYAALAVDMGDHILVVESGQSDARGMEVMAAAKQAIPGKPIRFVVNSHPHFDHASGLAAAVAEGATILTHNNNEEVLERLLSGPRTLTGDSLSKVTARRNNVVQGVGTRDVRRGTNGKVVEIHHVPNEHSDGMVVVYLPAEKVLYSADVTIVNPAPAQLGTVKSIAAALAKLNLDYTTFIPAHPPNPERMLTRDDFNTAAATP